MQKRQVAKALGAAAIVPSILLATAGNASAWDRRVDWKNVATGAYLTESGTSLRKVGGWWETKNSDGTFKLRWAGFGSGYECLDSNSKGSVYVIQCNGGNNQKWYEIKTSTGWKLKNKATGRVLDTAHGKAYTKPDNGSKYQRWR
ncbi:RICIN domain-containing protein [Streptomyces halobius]|uniref:RICIN domain-containing protein n=1 Tax=Streptomyces halobius TaxID=2879846 RepID=A0ABY4MFW6_9ACTN|nr:RICIN domain-containing protein [Streptomyces halobius]UQA95609.1 RICIN domain-containing protein [Streptomyces halobius]